MSNKMITEILTAKFNITDNFNWMLFQQLEFIDLSKVDTRTATFLGWVKLPSFENSKNYYLLRFNGSDIMYRTETAYFNSLGDTDPEIKERIKAIPHLFLAK